MWTPQPRQFALLAAKHVPVVLFGGARGGGKTDGALGDYLQDVPTGSSWTGLYIRQSYPELREVMDRARELYEPTGATFNKTERLHRWPNGANIIYQSIQSAEDARKVQGFGRAWINIDEAGNYPTDEVFRICLAANRGHPLARLRMTANPGGAGHSWLKSLFIDRGKPGDIIIDDDIERMFIASYVHDNKALLDQDPSYIDRLHSLGSPELVRAWLEGDWNVTLGAYFPEFSRAQHVIMPFELPSWWTRFRAIDWGMSPHPAACLWIAVADHTLEPEIPNGSLVVYREYYAGDASDKGYGLTAPEFALEVAKRSQGEEYLYSVADPSCLPQRGPVVRGPSIAEVFQQNGVTCRGGDNSRLAGWSQIRQRLRAKQLYIVDSCHHLIRTLPLLQHDKRKMEDLDTNGPDHLADALRYGCMSRPFTTTEPIEEEPRHLHVGRRSSMTWGDLHREIGFSVNG